MHTWCRNACEGSSQAVVEKIAKKNGTDVDRKQPFPDCLHEFIQKVLKLTDEEMIPIMKKRTVSSKMNLLVTPKLGSDRLQLSYIERTDL